MANHKTVYEDCDILIVGGGMAGTGATFESRYWGRDMKNLSVDKSNIDINRTVSFSYTQQTLPTSDLM